MLRALLCVGRWVSVSPIWGGRRGLSDSLMSRAGAWAMTARWARWSRRRGRVYRTSFTNSSVNASSLAHSLLHMTATAICLPGTITRLVRVWSCAPLCEIAG